MNSLLCKSTNNLKKFVDSANCDLSTFESGQISDEEAEERLKELEVVKNP